MSSFQVPLSPLSSSHVLPSSFSTFPVHSSILGLRCICVVDGYNRGVKV